MSDFPPSIRKLAWLALCVFVIRGDSSERVSAQSAGQISEVKRVAVDWPQGGKGTTGVHDRVKQKLKASGKVQIVQDATQANAVLHGSAVMWTTGYISMSPRSKGAKEKATEIRLQGSGSTFSAPIYQKWFESFERTRPEIQVRYDAVGSEEGIRRIRAGDLDFGASDMALSPEQLLGKGGKLLQFATVLGAVVPIYNVKGAPVGLNLTPEVLAGIFLGKIGSWNAPEIRAINKHVRLPDEKIVVVHRSDGSGTTYG